MINTVPNFLTLLRIALMREDGASLNAALESTARLALLFALLFAAGLLLGAAP